MFSVLNKCKINNLPVDLSLDMFEKMVIPSLLYGSEIWGFGNLINLERVQLKFVKYLLKLKRNTPNNMVYGETGLLPMEYHVNTRMLSFWVKLITGKQDKMSFKIYNLCLSLYRHGRLECKWLQKIQRLINGAGLTFVFEQQYMLDKKWLKNAFLPNIKNILKDQILQIWFNQVSLESEKCFHYKHFGMEYQLKKYFEILQPELWMPLCRFRTGNHKLPVEIYSWNNLYKNRNDRKCTICDTNDIGDEYHYIMICPVFKEIREIYLPKFYKNRPSVYKFNELMKCTKPKVLNKLARFVRDILQIFK